MRLAVFANQFPSAFSTYFARDMRGLIEAGVDVEVFPIYPLDNKLWESVPSILNENILPRNKIHHVSLRELTKVKSENNLRMMARLIADMACIGISASRYGIGTSLKSAYVALKAWILAQKYPRGYDHVLAYWGNYAATCGYIYHRLCKVQNPFSVFLHARVDLYRNPVYLRRKLTYADRIITCSDFNREYILDKFSDVDDLLKSKIHVHYHGLDFQELPFSCDSHTFGKIVAVGRFVKHKGFDYVLRAAQVLKGRQVPVTVEFIGDGEEAEALRSLTSELGIDTIVKFSGWLPADQVPTAIRNASVLVHPSPEIGDGVPNVIKEAMAVGTPVIGSTVAGIPELLGAGKYGMLVPAQDVNALADGIQCMLVNEQLRQSYANTARKFAEQKFDLWHNGRRLAETLAGTSRAGCQGGAE